MSSDAGGFRRHCFPFWLASLSFASHKSQRKWRRLGCGRLCGCPLEGNRYHEPRALSRDARHIDIALMLFEDAAREGESKAGAISLRRIKRAENVRQMFGQNSTPRIGYRDSGKLAASLNFDGNPSSAVNCLNRVQQEIEHHLVNLGAIVFDFGHRPVLCENDFDWPGK